MARPLQTSARATTTYRGTASQVTRPTLVNSSPTRNLQCKTLVPNILVTDTTRDCIEQFESQGAQWRPASRSLALATTCLPNPVSEQRNATWHKNPLAHEEVYFSHIARPFFDLFGIKFWFDFSFHLV